MDMNDFLKIANAASPELVEKTAVALAVLEKISPDHALEVREEMGKILARPSELLEKNASAGAAISRAIDAIPSGVKGALALGAGSALAGIGTAIATDLYDAARRGLTKGRNLKRILDANPELRKGFESKALNGAFSTLHRYAPDFTADPLMGGTILKAMAETPDNQLSIIKTLIDSRKNLLESKAKQYSPAKYPLKDIHDFNQPKKGVPANVGG